MQITHSKQTGFSIVKLLPVFVAVGVIGVTGWLFYQQDQHKTALAASNAATMTSQTTNEQENTTNAQPATAATWETYTSSKETASFKYPSDWTITKPILASSDSTNADQISITSPSGAITVTWASGITGFGNEHTASYPLNTVLDKTPIPGAPGRFVISGITTIDGSSYHSWLAVQTSNGITTSGVQGDLATFTSTHALNPTTKASTGLLFATCGPRTHENTPGLTKDQATAFFTSSEAQQAKDILLSLSERN